jgi:hypothetical protein
VHAMPDGDENTDGPWLHRVRRSWRCAPPGIAL